MKELQAKEIMNIAGAIVFTCADKHMETKKEETYSYIRTYEVPAYTSKWSGDLQRREVCNDKCCNELGTTSWSYGTQGYRDC